MALQKEAALLLIVYIITVCNAGMSQQGIERLKEDEGFRTTVYSDSLGYATVGWGHKLTTSEIPLYPVGTTLSTAQCEQLFQNDLASAEKNAENVVINYAGGQSTWDGLTQTRQDVLINMAYNLGYSGLANFRKMLTAIKNKNYDLAAEEMKDSTWYTQVTNRANRLIALMKSGTYDSSATSSSASTTNGRSYTKYAGKTCDGTSDLLRDFVGTYIECQAKCDELDCTGFVHVNSGDYAGKCFFRGGRIKRPYSYAADDRDCYIPGSYIYRIFQVLFNANI